MTAATREAARGKREDFVFPHYYFLLFPHYYFLFFSVLFLQNFRSYFHWRMPLTHSFLQGHFVPKINDFNYLIKLLFIFYIVTLMFLYVEQEMDFTWLSCSSQNGENFFFLTS